MAGVYEDDFGGQRRFRRVPMRLAPATVCPLNPPDDASPIEVQVVDLSRSGARLLAPAPLLEGSLLSVDLPLPDGSRLPSVTGRVLWSRPALGEMMVGVAFTQ